MTSPLPYRPVPLTTTNTGMTPQLWAYLTPAQQYQHVAQYGPPPAWYPQSVYAAPAPQYAPQAVSVAVAQSVVVQRERHIAHGLHLVLTLLTGGLWGFVWLAIVIFKR
jgi:hypothetical protein